MEKRLIHACHFGRSDEVKAKFRICRNFQFVERGLDDFSEQAQINLAGSLPVAKLDGNHFAAPRCSS
jgi:hypothetical protein